jgi:hypothetical protein
MPTELLEQAPDPQLNPNMRMESVLDSRTVMDEQGYQRRIYDLSPNVSVSFRGREELPTISNSNLGEGVSSMLLTPDEQPREVELKEFESYVASHSKTDSAAEHLIANATPLGIIDLAVRLKGDKQPDAELMELRGHLLSGEIGDKENALLDILSAAVLAEPNPNAGVERTDGLLDAALALNGDKTKRAELTDKMKVLEAQEKHLVLAEIGEGALGLVFEHQPTEPEVIKHAEGLVLVRTTNNEPVIDKDGTVSMQPASEYSKAIHGISGGNAYVPRQTTHFSLNHHVQSHVLGNFEDRGYTVVAPLTKALEANGRPAVLFGVDTYFTSGPGEKVSLPMAIILEGGKDQSEIVVNEGNTRRFKTHDFKPEDIGRLLNEFESSEAFSAISEKGERSPYLRACIIDAGREARIVTDDGKYRDRGEGGSFEDRQVIGQSRLEQMSTKDMLSTVLQEQPQVFERFMQTLTEDLVTQSAIVEQGGDVVYPSGTSNYVDSAGFDERVTKLAEELDVRVGLHSGMIERQVEEAAITRLIGKNMRQGDNDRYEWEKPNKGEGERLNEYLTSERCPQRLRRAALEAGLLTVRGGEQQKYDKDEETRLKALGLEEPIL